MSTTKEVIYTAFGKTLPVKAELHNMTTDEEPEAFLWAERAEDYYALMSPQLKGKRVAIITRNNWLTSVDNATTG